MMRNHACMNPYLKNLKKVGKHMIPYLCDEYGFDFPPEEPDPVIGESVVVFVYGSLKKGYKQHAMIGQGKFLETVETAPNYLLYDLGPYPGMIEVHKGEGRKIEGEIYRLTPEEYKNLNKHVPYGFKNREIEVIGVDLPQIIALIYKQGIDRFPDCGTSWPPE